jgi:hypothetical protein
MILKEYQPEQYEMIVEWWTSHGWAPIAEPLLPKTGLLVYDDDDTPRAVIWVYRTDSVLMLAEWLVTNPENSAKQSYIAVKELLNAVTLISDAAGGYLMTFLQDPSLIKLFKKQVFNVEEKPYTMLHHGGV